MLCVVIKGPTFQEAYQQILKALAYADLVELRLDGFTFLDMHALKELCSQFSIPMIFTLRSQIQGGSYTRSEEERLTVIDQLADLKPAYLDLESDVPYSYIQKISTDHPEVKLILSHHNFVETPEDLEGLYREMQKTPAYFYKIAVMAQSSVDALRLICWAKQSDDRLIAISMGLKGQLSRILAPLIGCPIPYVALEEDQNSAIGQLSAETLIKRYRYHSLSPQTALYGLIGDPVDQSISDVTHNRFFEVCGLDALYVKIPVTPSELPEFISLAQQFSFHGMSVTMPLKEAILPFLDYVEPQALDIGAVNTLLFEGGRVCGYNTDGMGALNAIEKECPQNSKFEGNCGIKGKRIVIIGAGGAARAIAYEAQLRGALVTIINRNEKKALEVAQCLGSIGKGLDDMGACAEEGYDILIQCTPVSMPIQVDHILPGTLVMDITTKPKKTAFLKQAKERGCPVIYGYQMFVEQALGQFQLWFKDST